MADRRVVVIVDANASAARLAAAFVAEGCACVRVRSVAETAPHRGTDVFEATIVHNGVFADTLAAVAPYRPIAVMPGGEVGVELADALGEALGVAGNGTAGSYARRAKDAQLETVRAAGLPTARQLSVTDAEQLVDWHRALGGRIVVKPIRSARNDGVSFCDTPEESAAAYRKLIDSVNVYGVRNEGVVAQEYMSGHEYIVNTVSWLGHHRTTDVWRYTKITVNGVPDRINGMTSVGADDPVHAELSRHAHQVLDALGIRYGPVHLELMRTADGLRLVEAGARLCGEDVAHYASMATGESQVDRTVQAVLRPELFLAECRLPYRRAGYAAMVFMASPVAGTLRSYPLMPLVEALRSYRGRAVKVHPGDVLRRTVDDSSEPLMVGLAHADEAVLTQDFTTMIYLDGFGFYDVEPA